RRFLQSPAPSLPWSRRRADRPLSEAALAVTKTDESGKRLFDRAGDLADVLDRALHEEVDAGALAALPANVGEQADDSLLRRIGLHQPVEHADLARGAVVHRGAVENREHRARSLDTGTILAEDPLGSHVGADGELVLVRHEDLEALRTQKRRALVDVATLVRREERPREIDPHLPRLIGGAGGRCRFGRR